MPAPTDDGVALVPTHAALHGKELLPQVQVVDTGYMDSKLLVSSRQQYGIDLVGPPRRDQRWQAQAGQGFAAQDFMLDGERGIATCPLGRTSTDWRAAIDNRRNHVVKICFAAAVCGPRPQRSACTTSARHRRTVTVRPQAQHEALAAARAHEGTRAYVHDYDQRAGIEGTLSYGVRTMGLRRSRYTGLGRTHLQHVLTATAINFVRVSQWFAGTARVPTRRSAFARLHQCVT